MYASISGSGLIITFGSTATNLSRADGRSDEDIYLRNMGLDKTTLVTTPTGQPGGDQQHRLGRQEGAWTSLDGNWVLFNSVAVLDPAHRQHGSGVFVYDRRTGRTSLASIGSGGKPHAGTPIGISGEGRYVVWKEEGALYRRDRVRHRTELVSLPPDADAEMRFGALSADGNSLAFWAFDRRLRAPQQEFDEQLGLFVRDIRRGTTQFVRWSGWNRDTESFLKTIDLPAVSADGRRVVYSAATTGRSSGKEWTAVQVYVWDRSTQRSRLISAAEATDRTPSHEPSLSADGRFAVFKRTREPCQHGPGYPESEFGGCAGEIVVHEIVSGVERIASSGSGGRRANDDSFLPSISADGRYVAFSSRASNLVSGRPWYTCRNEHFSGRCPVVYLKDMATGAIWIVSVA